MRPNLWGLARYLDWTGSEGKNQSVIEARESKTQTNWDDPPESALSSYYPSVAFYALHCTFTLQTPKLCNIEWLDHKEENITAKTEYSDQLI